MPDVFARLAERLSSPAEPGFTRGWGEETVYERQSLETNSTATSSAVVPGTLAPARAFGSERRGDGNPERPTSAEAPASPPGTNPERLADPSPAAAGVLRSGDEPVRPRATSQASLPSRAAPAAPSLAKVISMLEPGTEARVQAPRAREHRQAPAPTSVTVEIGQIVVRPPAAAPPPAVAETTTSAAAGTLSLSDYLAGRR